MPDDKKVRSRPLPDEAYADLALILQHADKLEAICAVVGQTQSLIDKEIISSSVAEKTGLPEEDAKRIVGALMAFQRVRIRKELDIDKFVKWLEKHFAEYLKEKNDINKLKEWERNLLSIKSVLDEGSAFGILIKAIELIFTHQNVLSNLRILTDIRPVYDKDANNIQKMVITHQLVLNYEDNLEEKRLYLALDSSDLDELKEQCNRAKKKAAVAVNEFKDASWVTYVAGENDG